MFKSKKGKNEILLLYDKKLKGLNLDFEYLTVQTSFGKTNIIATGDPANPPIIVVHGSNACAPISLETYPNLSTHFQVFAVDVLAQPNKSAATRLSMKDDSYGKWMNEVIAALKIDNVVLVGFSFGGLVILKTLIHNEVNIKEVFLAAPAYIVNGNPLKALFKVFIPMRRYMMTKKIKFVKQFLGGVFSERDQFAISYLSKVFLHFKMDFTPVPVISKAEAKGITTPITLIAAKNDLMFPGEKMLRRASKIFSSVRTVLLEQSKHVQSKADNSKIEALIMKSGSKW